MILTHQPANTLCEAIRAALDCPSHFDTVTVTCEDPLDQIGDKAIVICTQCVDRLREAIGLAEGVEVPQSYEVEWRYQDAH